MAGKNYRRGTSAEDRCRKALELLGFTAWRAYASKGPADVFGTRPGLLVAVQVKRTKKRLVSVRAVASHCRGDLLGKGDDKVCIGDLKPAPGLAVQVWLWTDISAGSDLAGWRYYEVRERRLYPIDGPLQVEQPKIWQVLQGGAVCLAEAS